MDNDFVLFKDLTNNTMEILKKLRDSKSLTTGFADLDNAIKGLNNSSLNVIASRPAMGKTSLTLNIAMNVAIKNNILVVIFSLDFSKERLFSRMLTTQTMIDKNKIITGKLNNKEWQKICETIKILSNKKIYIDDTAEISIDKIREKCIRLKQKEDIGLIVIDNLELISCNKNCNFREKEITIITSSLKELAEELKLPIIVTCDVSKTAEERIEDPRPKLADLKYSESIVKNADVIMFLYRDSYYNNNAENKNIAEVIIAKNRYGYSNNITVRLLFLLEYLKFVSIE